MENVEVRDGEDVVDVTRNKVVTVDRFGRTRVRTVFRKPTKTQQQFKDQTDVNLIMEKYRKTNEMTHLNAAAGVYEDLSTPRDFRNSLEVVMRAETAFLSLPSRVREKFANDPHQLLEFLSKEENRDEAVKLGLVEKKKEPVPSDADRIVEAVKSLAPKAPKKPVDD